MTTEELRREGFDVYTFPSAEARRIYRELLLMYEQIVPIETSETEGVVGTTKLFFLGVRMLRGKAVAQAALEAACD